MSCHIGAGRLGPKNQDNRAEQYPRIDFRSSEYDCSSFKKSRPIGSDGTQRQAHQLHCVWQSSSFPGRRTTLPRYFCASLRIAAAHFNSHDSRISIRFQQFSGQIAGQIAHRVTENYSVCDARPAPPCDGIVAVQDLAVLAECLSEERK
jgi:hypothetical protein